VLLPRQQTMPARGAKDKEHAMFEKGNDPFALRDLTVAK